MLDLVPDGPANDREYINKAFSVVFPDDFIKKLIKKGAGRQIVLEQLREKKRYATIKGKRIDILKHSKQQSLSFEMHTWRKSIVR